MSKLTDRFDDHGCYNAHNFAGHGNVFVLYIPADNGRGGHSAKWQVIRPGFQTDPKGHWTDNGNKTFDVWNRNDKAPQLQAALDWAQQRYGVTTWAKTPYGSWMDAEVIKSRLAEILGTEAPEAPRGRLKVFSYDLPIRLPGRGYVQCRCVIATTSKKKAAASFGMSLHEFNNYGGETGNDFEIKLATARPEVVMAHLEDCSREAEVGEWIAWDARNHKPLDTTKDL